LIGCPDQESFVHRSGRTGRAGKAGLNIVFCSNIEDRQVKTKRSETKEEHGTRALPASTRTPFFRLL